jgi:uncharacterized protein (DUF2126 family)
MSEPVRCRFPERHKVPVNGHVLALHPTPRAGEHVAAVRFRAWAPPHSLQPHIGIHHPVRLDVIDTWGRRSLGSCAYHVWHPEGRAFDAPPLTRFEAAARRAQRFTVGQKTSGTALLPSGPYLFPVVGRPAATHPEAPVTLDLRRLPLDRPMPVPEADAATPAAGAGAGAGAAASGGDGARSEHAAPGLARAPSALNAR